MVLNCSSAHNVVAPPLLLRLFSEICKCVTFRCELIILDHIATHGHVTVQKIYSWPVIVCTNSYVFAPDKALLSVMELRQSRH